MRTATYHALMDIQRERQRQEYDEGWTPEHDDEHASGELVHAAVCYAMGDNRIVGRDKNNKALGEVFLWPWDAEWWKPGTDRRRQLVKAGALIVAELERLERASALTRPLIDSDINAPR